MDGHAYGAIAVVTSRQAKTQTRLTSFFPVLTDSPDAKRAQKEALKRVREEAKRVKKEEKAKSSKPAKKKESTVHSMEGEANDVHTVCQI